MVMELKYADFNKFISSSKPVLVDFWASWCMPCKLLAPVVEQLSLDYSKKIVFAKISIADYPQLSNEVGITGIPCLIIFKNGKEVDRIPGFNTATVLRSKIDEILKKI